MYRCTLITCFSSCLMLGAVAAAEPTEVKNLWEGDPPGYQVTSGPERDTSDADSRTVAGKRVVRLGNVSVPQLHLYVPENPNGTSVVICPGGGFSILAWDLEGTEVAEWLNTIGVTAGVLKYRVPTRDADARWLPPTQDAQRALSMMRSLSEELKLNPDRVGVLGFSAGGHTAARAALAQTRHYEPRDEIDGHSCAADFGILAYPAYLVEEGKLSEELVVNESSPPMFFVHAQDDRVTCQSSVQLFSALQSAGVPSELHVYAGGGHGFGMRKTDQPVSLWPAAAERWMQYAGLIP